MPEPGKAGLSRKLALYWSMVRYGLAHHLDFAKEHYEFFAAMQQRLLPLAGDLRGSRILDLGCGKTFWLTLLLHSWGAQVTGIDTEAVEPGKNLGKYLGLWKTNGPERAARTLVWDFIFAGPYYRELAKYAPFPLNFRNVDVRAQGIEEFRTPDGSLDLVVSHEVFEHLPDVPLALDQVRRMLKPTGLTYIYVHNFASLSGGHHIAWKYPDTEPSTEVPPWDHLREKRFPDIPSWINGWRERDYRRAFAERFEIVDWFPLAREGEKLLTPAIQAELADYSADELLTKGFVVIARPKP
ncbi:MAG: class I SAM-dependent methyltransferase [Deltaproteobacteria bacterium]|nr:class I SAM-dependent methyltransferase [Deltaproteobacteria bacterium]